MKKILIVIGSFIIIFGVIGGGIWYWQKNKVVNDQPVTINQQTTSTQQEVGQDSTSTRLTYKNDKYGFELNFPVRWNFQVEEKANSLIFNLKLLKPLILDDGTKLDYHEIMVASAFSREDWAKNQSENNPDRMSYLGENSDYVFGYLFGQDDEGYFPKGTASPFQDLQKIIIPSFRILK